MNSREREIRYWGVYREKKGKGARNSSISKIGRPDAPRANRAEDEQSVPPTERDPARPNFAQTCK